MKKFQGKFGKTILTKFWIKFLGNFDWIILNKIVIFKTLDYFLVKFELISSIEVKSAPKKTGGKFKENSRKIRKFRKKIGERLKKFVGNFTLNLGKICRKSVEFQN